MEKDKLIMIFNKVLDLSKTGKIEWISVNSSDDYFVCDINDRRISVYLIALSYEFNVEDSEGKSLGNLSHSRLFNSKDELQIKRMYDLARNKALKIDKSLDNLFDNLDDIN